MTKKTYVSIIGMVLSIGGWFLWTIILAAIYKPRNDKAYNQYPVYDDFLVHYGRDFSWWLNTFLIVSAVILYDIAVSSLRKAFWPTDTDVFQELEKDPIVRERFEETVRVEREGLDGEVKMGRDTKTSTEIQREDDIQALLNRRRVMDDSRDITPTSPVVAVAWNSEGNGLMRRRVSTDVTAAQAAEPSSPRKPALRHSVDIAEVLGGRV